MPLRLMFDSQPSIHPSDEALIERLRGGDGWAGDVLVEKYCQPLMRYLHRLGGSEQVAEELHQQTWLSVLDHLDRFNAGSGRGGFKAWLFRIATNKANDHWRANGRDRDAKQVLEMMLREQDSPAVDNMEVREQQEKLRRAIEQLPESQRQVLLLRYYGNFKFVEIAQMLGCPLNTALGRMHKAMLKLRQLLEEP